MKIVKRRALVSGAVATLLLGATGGGVVYTAALADGADRTAPVKAWQASEQGVPDMEELLDHHEEGRVDTALSKALLPVPDGYQLGPDIDELGNDTHLSGAKAEAWLAQDAGLLPAEALAEHRKFVSKLDLQGMAMRSYVNEPAHNRLVTIRLAQMKNTNALKERNAFRAELADIFSALREGPEIEGHKNATCFLLPEPEVESGSAGVEEMYCTAYEDDTLITFSATGSAPFAEKKAAKLLEKQLDRLAEGGGISV